jgi:hypothetical protein
VLPRGNSGPLGKYLIILAEFVECTHNDKRKPEEDVNMEDVKFNVRGEPVFSVMAAGWFCEKSG